YFIETPRNSTTGRVPTGGDGRFSLGPVPAVGRPVGACLERRRPRARGSEVAIQLRQTSGRSFETLNSNPSATGFAARLRKRPGANPLQWRRSQLALVPPGTVCALMPEIETSVLPNGLPLHRVALDGTRAITLLVAFDAGARTEHPDENGMAHFL